MQDFEYQKIERINFVQEEKIIIERLTEFLFQENLITLEEKADVAKLIREAEAK